MKKIVLVYIVFGLTPFLLADSVEQLDFERGIMPDKADACEMAKVLARKNYVITQMNGCTCERTDSHEWLCDAYFKYSSKKDSK